MKQKLLLLMAGCILLVACGKAEKEFDEKISMADLKMTSVLLTDAIIHDAVAEAWHNAIFKNVTPSGKRCNDFSEALKEVSDSIRVYEIDSKAREINEELLNITSELNSPPSSRKDCYNDFVDIVSDVSTLTRTVLDISGSYKSYSNKTGELFDEISKKRDQFKIKYGALLKINEKENMSEEPGT